MSDLEKVLEGAIGFFWPFVKRGDLDAEPMRGYVQLRNDRWLTVDALDEDPLETFGQSDASPRNAPDSMVGSTDATGVLLLNSQSHGSNIQFGGSKASTRHYRFRTLLAGVSLELLRSPLTRGVSGSFGAALPWAGMNAVKETRENSTDGRNLLMKLTIELDGQGQSVSSGVFDGMQVELKPTWTVSGSRESRNIQTALQIQCTSRKLAPAGKLIETLKRVQALLWLCHGRLIECGSAQAMPNYSSDEVRKWVDMWDDRLLETDSTPRPPRASKPTDWPIVSLADLGGKSGLRRWLRFYRDHGRFLGPIVHGYRNQRGIPVESRVLDLSAAIEYFVAYNAKMKRSWAKDRHRNRALAMHSSARFRKWVGDVEVWAEALRVYNNELKHDPSASLNPYRASLLAQSAEVLITCVALDYVATNRGPSNRYLTDYRIQQLGERLQKELGTD